MRYEALSRLYGAERWPRAAERSGRCDRFVIPLGLFEQGGFRLASRDALPSARRAYRSYYVHEDDDDRRIMVDVVPASSYEEAKEALLEHLSCCARIVPPASARADGRPEVGDVAFGGTGGLGFVRSNLFIALSNAGGENVDVRPFSRNLDEVAMDCLA